MANKETFTNRGSTSLKGRFIQTKRSRRTSPSASLQSQFVEVRDATSIPAELLDFFQMDPKTKLPYTNAERTLLAQTYLHEIEEGVQQLVREGRLDEARMISDFTNGLHTVNRLELLRQTLKDPSEPSAPQKIQKTHKLRNNQTGAIRCQVDKYPVVAMTEMGFGYKACNEDALLVEAQRKILAMADGMGGHIGGHIASGIAVDFFEYAIRHGMVLEEAVAFANSAIMARTKSDSRLGGMRPMGTTFAAVELNGHHLKVAYIGDTKVMVLRNGNIAEQTRDHTQGQLLLCEGLVDTETAFELNHILNRCLGMDLIMPNRDISLHQWDLLPGDRVLLATDGITDNFFEDNFQLNELAQMAHTGPLPQAAHLIIDTALSRMTAGQLPCGRPSKCDNLSLILLEFPQ